MALLHRAELDPTKLDLLTGWLPTRSWFTEVDATGLQRVGAYRFDDPAGEVGIETMLVRAGDGPTYQVALTYRGAPLDDGDAWLIGTTEHSVLGRRWVYDACGDPVYAAALASAVLAGTGQADEEFEVEGKRVYRALTMVITSTATPDRALPAVDAVNRVDDGDPTVVVTDGVELAVVRRVGADHPGSATLSGTWDGQTSPLLLAFAR